MCKSPTFHHSFCFFSLYHTNIILYHNMVWDLMVHHHSNGTFFLWGMGFLCWDPRPHCFRWWFRFLRPCCVDRPSQTAARTSHLWQTAPGKVTELTRVRIFIRLCTYMNYIIIYIYVYMSTVYYNNIIVIKCWIIFTIKSLLPMKCLEHAGWL